jgi:hypothetical protein
VYLGAVADTPKETPEQRVARERVEQGLPPQLEDPVIIEKLVAIIEEHDARMARAR